MISEAFSNLIDSVITELVTILWKRFMGIAPWRFMGIAPWRLHVSWPAVRPTADQLLEN